MATSAYKDLPESHGVQEAVSKLCQGSVDKDAAKHACFEHPRNIQEALNAVKQYQYISQAVDGQKPRARRTTNDIAVNQITLEDVKKVVEDVMNRKVSDGDKSQAKPGVECYFCKSKGHFKRDCRKYAAWLKKKEQEGEAKEVKPALNK